MPIVEVKNVSHVYTSGEEEFTALKNISFEINEGEFVALVGHNGSGKSTLAKMLNGLILPTEGEVISAGVPTTDDKRIFEIRRQVGVVFQNPDNQMVATIIEDDVAFGPENLGIAPDEIDRRVDWALNVVGMSEHRKGTATRLSGGQKQRIAIAGILAMKPRVLVLDESTSMLDPEGRKSIISVVKKLNKEEGMTIVMITHYMDEAAAADKIILLNEGKIEYIGGREIFLREEMLYNAGLDVTIPARVANALRKKGLDLPQEVLDTEQLSAALLKLKDTQEKCR